jgi:hypothetical protein
MIKLLLNTHYKRVVVIFLSAVTALWGIMVLFHYGYQSPELPIFKNWQFTDKPVLKLNADTKNLYHLHLNIDFKNFELSSICTRAAATTPKAHIHLYVNNKFYISLYEHKFDIPTAHLNAGDNVIMITLQSPDHRFITVNRQPIYQKMIIHKDNDILSVKNHIKNTEISLSQMKNIAMDNI